MYLSRKIISVFFICYICCFNFGCASAPKQKPIPISEQIVLDMQKSQDLMIEFQRKITRVPTPEVQDYLNRLAQSIAKQEPGFEANTVEVRVYQDLDKQDLNKQIKRIYAFPGTTIFIPASFLVQVGYENELAAAISYELAQVIHRYLAKKLDAPIIGEPAPVILFGPESVFNFEREERKMTIQKATELMFKTKFDTRGLPSFFQHYASYLTGVWNQDSDLVKNEVEFNLREARKAMAAQLPLRDPIVRSADFINFKKKLKL